MLPQPSLSGTVAAPLLEGGGDVVLASNPCRLQFFTKEVVVLAAPRVRLFQQHLLRSALGALHCRVFWLR